MEAVKILRAVAVLGLALASYRLVRRWWMRRLMGQRVAGKVVLITGASSGLGEALARAYHAAGAKVILAARNTHELERVKGQLDSVQGRPNALILPLDLSDGPSLADKACAAVDMYGRVDVLINNAGVSSRGAGLETSLDTDRRVMEVNYFGTIAFTKGVVGAMVSAGGGQVVVISSLQGKVGVPLRTSYAASKHALQGYFDSLRGELAESGVSVTVVSPGYIQTQLSQNALTGDGSQHGVMDKNTANGMTAEAVAKEIVEGVARHCRDIILAPPTHKLAVYLSVLAPSLLDYVLRLRQRFQ
ncbi:dehydrogenase/reductase SDR family protein 7-like [Halichondria panicea]|uniref:dehydrogenase/reductase SDR family protein 7-like n=1 Tax=Halichondria panicea TaxID=6063 RepID=UPI00312B474C